MCDLDVLLLDGACERAAIAFFSSAMRPVRSLLRSQPRPAHPGTYMFPVIISRSSPIKSSSSSPAITLSFFSIRAILSSWFLKSMRRSFSTGSFQSASSHRGVPTWSNLGLYLVGEEGAVPCEVVWWAGTCDATCARDGEGCRDADAAPDMAEALLVPAED